MCPEGGNRLYPATSMGFNLAYVDVYKMLYCQSVDTHCSNQSGSSRLRGRSLLTVLGSVR